MAAAERSGLSVVRESSESGRDSTLRGDWPAF